MAAEKKKPTRRSVKGAKRVGSSNTVIPPVPVSEIPVEQKGIEDIGQDEKEIGKAPIDEFQIDVMQADETPIEKKPQPVNNPSAKPGKKQASKPKAQKKEPRKILVRVFQVTVMVLVVVLVAAVGLFSWDRWFRYDDAQDFQGQWTYVDGATEVSVAIDADTIRIDDEVSYDYEIDPWAKTVTFSFSNLEGGANYRFSEDRSTIIICEDAQAVDWLTEIELALNLTEIDTGFTPDTTIYLKHV